MPLELTSLDLVLRLLHVDGLGRSPNLVDVDRESARRLLANRFELHEDATIDDIIAWFLNDKSEATDAERGRIRFVRRIAQIEHKMVTRLKPFRKE